jgi:hypothetical protein
VRELVLALIAAIIIEVLFDISTRVARRLVSWSAYRIYVDDPERAETRAQEWKAVIEEAPKYFSLFQAVPFAGVAVGKITARRCRAVRVRSRRRSMRAGSFISATFGILAGAITVPFIENSVLAIVLVFNGLATTLLIVGVILFIRRRGPDRSMRAFVGTSVSIQYTIVRRQTPHPSLQQRDDKVLPPGEPKP